MSRRFECSVESSVSLQQIHAAFSERDYWLENIAPHSETTELDSFTVDPNGDVRLRVVQDLRNAVLPGVLAKLYPRGLELVQDETWILDRGEEVRGEVHVHARGAPGSAHSTVVMVPTHNGERIKCSGTIKVKVPIVGGKLESHFGRHLADQTPEMLRMVMAWIKENA
ncbi:DUF2505 domain-containing protein [Mycolicibacterium celeriflavum]|uniref:Uncharacterized protein n=1 Tax=Mycolicibacterium celeriflavum TaxID=1249101 RepID=A0A1X0BVN2_MYCCF|nr:DUF2505 domain-containing protein [Mycolicibacterium celeriflavum]MCV7240717.1 DUF2505 domain-containing protein [Mycolicibacterium celeriflavum]ORA48183.1 hypothetical protein BST21_11305 [Mycolicibacterium celeriflavum]BBY43567.1 hypothetical protein MCEL_18620 [Mycolicibacterium celeriflavum]